MNKPIISSFLQETANAFASIDGVEAVAWCGSSAMRSADSYSDFDFYVYTQIPLPVWIASYTDILFAVNGRYHPGEKRLMGYLADLPSRPENALEDIAKLCGLAASLASPIVEHITTMLKRLDEWLNRVR